VREKISADLGLWLSDGVISSPLHDLLKERYSAPGFVLGQIIKSAGVAGGMFAVGGILGFVGALTESRFVIVLMLAGCAAGLFAFALRLWRDPAGAFLSSSRILFALSVTLAASAIGVLVDSLGLPGEATLFYTGLICVPGSLAVSYFTGSTFLLTLSLLGFFHWAGSWTRMAGNSTYEFSVQDPRIMAGVSILVSLAGLYHELRVEKFQRFHRAYESLGLVYLNMTLLVLSIFPGENKSPLLYVILLSLACVAQIALGSRLHNSIFTGFGVVFLSIDFFTRYYETFWDKMHKGLFFLLGGLFLVAAGGVCEYLLRGRKA